MAVICTPQSVQTGAVCYGGCLPDKSAAATYLLSVIAGGSTNPDTLVAAATCLACLRGLFLEAQVYLLARATGSSTDPQTLATQAQCWDCIADREAADIYLLANWAGITDPNTISLNSAGFSKIGGFTPEVQTLLLANIAGVSVSDPNALVALVRCFSCIPAGLLRVVRTMLLCQAVNAAPAPPAGQDFGIDWTPSNIDLPSEFGLWAFIAPELLNVTDLSINASTQREGYDIESTASLVTLTFPNLTAFTDASYFFLKSNQALTTLSFPALVSSTTNAAGTDFTIQSNPVLTAISFPSLVNGLGNFFIRLNASMLSASFPVMTHIDGNFRISDHNSLTSISIPACLITGGSVNFSSNPALVTIALNAGLLVTNGSTWDLDSCALNQATVDLVLHRWNNTPGITGGFVDLSLGTNATPSAAGLADKAALIGKGVTVNTN